MEEMPATLDNREVNFRQVQKCPKCGRPVMRVPVLRCADCGQEHPLHCYVYKASSGKYIAECLDLDLMSQSDDLADAIGKLQEAMFSYLEVAFEGSTEGLVLRPAPWSHWLRYRLFRLKSKIRSGLRGTHKRHFLPPNSEFGGTKIHQQFCHC
jgi:predicted RNase H-like HicB family nuclease